MLSDEEKEALEILELYFGENSALNITKYVNIVLNLIEKQSKEIEELKTKNKILEAISLSFNEIQDRDKHWKDKIKAKTEEVNDGTYDAKIVLQSLLKEE